MNVIRQDMRKMMTSRHDIPLPVHEGRRSLCLCAMSETGWPIEKAMSLIKPYDAIAGNTLRSMDNGGVEALDRLGCKLPVVRVLWDRWWAYSITEALAPLGLTTSLLWLDADIDLADC